MQFSASEMMFFIALSQGPAPGELMLPPPQEPRERILEETIATLQDKNVLDQTRKLTKLGVIPARAVQLYKTAGTHLRINGRLLAGITDDGGIVGIVREKDSYALDTFHPALLLKMLLESSEYLKKASQEDTPEHGEETLPPEQWHQTLPDTKDYITLEHLQDGIPCCTKIYYADQGGGYLYEPDKQMRTPMSPLEMRRSLMRELNIPLERQVG